MWRNHEWLTEVIMALTYNGFGVIGLSIWKFMCTCTVVAFLAIGLAETGASPSLQLCALVAATVVITPYTQFRPQLFTFVLFSAMLALLARHTYRGSARLWLVIPIMALWANLHGGFIVGIITLTLYAGANALDDLIAGRPLERGMRLALTAVAGILATLLTPYGTNTWLAVLHALTNPVTRSVITDWRPLTIFIGLSYKDAAYFLYPLALIGGLAVSFCLTPRAGDLPLVAVAAIISVGAFVALRNVPLAAIACVTPITHHTALALAERRPHSSFECKNPSFQTEPVG